MKELNYDYRWIYCNSILYFVIVGCICVSMYFDFASIDRVNFELEHFVDILPYLLLLIGLLWNFLTTKIVKVNSKGLHVFSFFNKEIAHSHIDKGNVLGVQRSSGWGQAFLIVTKDKAIPLRNLKNESQTEKWLIEEYGLTRLPDKENTWGCLQFVLIAIIFSAFSWTIRDIDNWPSVRAWKKNLPLQDVTVADFSGTLGRDITISEYKMYDGELRSRLNLDIEEYPKVNFTYLSDSELSNAIAHLRVNDSIPAGTSVQLKLRPRDLKFLQYGTATSKEKRNLRRRKAIQVFSIATDDQLLVEKCCLKE